MHVFFRTVLTTILRLIKPWLALFLLCPSTLQLLYASSSPPYSFTTNPHITTISQTQNPKKQAFTTRTSNVPLVESITFAHLQELMQPNPDTVRVINFWATTCRPCIEELPDFERLHREYGTAKEGAKPLQVVFVSLDFKRDVESNVIPFVKKRGFTARCIFLGAPKSTEIDAVDSTWTGSMPATLMLGTKAGQRMFFEKKMHYEELKDFVKTYLFP